MSKSKDTPPMEVRRPLLSSDRHRLAGAIRDLGLDVERLAAGMLWTADSVLDKDKTKISIGLYRQRLRAAIGKLDEIAQLARAVRGES